MILYSLNRREVKDLYTTGDLFKQTGITERSIRYYSNLDLLNTTKNTRGQLVLVQSDLVNLVQIFASKILGYRLKELKDSKLQMNVLKVELNQKIADLEEILIRLDNYENEETLLNTLYLLHKFIIKYLPQR